MNDTFSAHRLRLLLRGDFIMGWRSLLLISGALAGVVLAAAMIAPDDHAFDADLNDNPSFHRALFTAAPPSPWASRRLREAPDCAGFTVSRSRAIGPAQQ